MLRPKQVNFQSLWQDACQPRFLSLFSPNNYDNSQPKLSAFELYSWVYELCVAVPDNHTQRLLQAIADMLHSVAAQMKTDIISQQHQHQPGAFLEAFLRNWRLFHGSSRALNATCRYLNKCLAAAKRPNQPSPSVTLSGGSSYQVEDVMGLCQLVWRRVLLEELNDSYGLLEVIISSWTEPFIDEVIESYIWSQDDSLVLALKAHLPMMYATKSQQFLQSSPVAAYIPFAAALLEAEQERLNRLLPAETAALLLNLCESELIGRHTAALQEEFNSVLKAGDNSQLLLLYSLLERNVSALNTLQSTLTTHVLTSGQEAINTEGLNGLLRITEYVLTLLREAFNDSRQMTEAGNAALSKLLNDHLTSPAMSLTEAALSAATSGSENGALRSLLPLLRDFETFYTCFQESLARVICFPVNAAALASDDPANTALTALIQSICRLPACSPERACHLKQMLRDAQHHRYHLQEPPVSVQLLTAHSWPHSFDGTVEASNTEWFPQAAAASLERFTQGFLTEHEGRKISWCPQLTSVEVQDNLTGKRYLMTLRQFKLLQDGSVGDDGDGADDEECQQVSRLLLHQAAPTESDSVNNSHSTYSTHTSHSSSNIISLIPERTLHRRMDSTSSVLGTGPVPAKRPPSDYTHVLQCTLVSLLKRRQRLSPTELFKLCKQATLTLKHGNGFMAEDEQIQGAVGVLMDKGFVEWNKGDNVYIYLA